MKLPFADAYLAGRTPIPCVTCNSKFKFEYLLARAHALGASQVASGHYARIDVDPATRAWRLRRAADAGKDQSYFLFELRQEQLAGLRFPLGELTKAQVRERARALGLATAEKPESQEICFIPDGDTAAAVERLRPGALPGAGRDRRRATGAASAGTRASITSRSGSGAASASPRRERLYVTGLDATHNRVRVGPLAALAAQGARLERVNWIAGAPPAAPIRASVRVRHRHEGAEAWVTPQPQGGALVRFDAPVSAVTPGQAAVFDAGDVVLGGGWIAESLS